MVNYKKEGQNLLKHLRKKGAIKRRWRFRNGKNYRQNFYDLRNWAVQKGHIKSWRFST